MIKIADMQKASDSEVYRWSVERRLYKLGKTKMDVFRALKFFTPVNHPAQIYNAISGKSNNPLARMIRNQTAIQLSIWEHHQEEEKRRKARELSYRT